MDHSCQRNPMVAGQPAHNGDNNMRSPQFGRRHDGGCGGRSAAEHARHRQDQRVFHHLLDQHAHFSREVEVLPNGIRTTTLADNPELAAQLKAHAHSMHERLQINLPLRRWDTLYAELFRHGRALDMHIEELPNGVRVLETSDDPEVVKLIHAHGRAVDAFVAHGPAASQRPSPMPADYQPQGGRS